jgi:hypothetical protein
MLPHSTGWHSKAQKLAAVHQLAPTVAQGIPAGRWCRCQESPAGGGQWEPHAWPAPWTLLVPRLPLPAGNHCPPHAYSHHGFTLHIRALVCHAVTAQGCNSWEADYSLLLRVVHQGCNTKTLCLAELSKQCFDRRLVTAHMITAGPTGTIQEPEQRHGACMLCDIPGVQHGSEPGAWRLSAECGHQLQAGPL